jgi:hypothetical protein
VANPAHTKVLCICLDGSGKEDSLEFHTPVKFLFELEKCCRKALDLLTLVGPTISNKAA